MSYLVDWRRLQITRFTIGMRHGLLIGVVGSTIGDSQQVMFNCSQQVMFNPYPPPLEVGRDPIDGAFEVV